MVNRRKLLHSLERSFYLKFFDWLLGDRLLGSDSQVQQWTTAQNVTQTISYPKTGVGSIISYIEVVVEQSSNLGRGYVTSGGIGQRQISITIEANKTTIFRETTQLYGY